MDSLHVAEAELIDLLLASVSRSPVSRPKSMVPNFNLTSND